MNDTLKPGPDPTRFDVTWEFDLETESIDGVDLASLIFSSGAGQCRVDNFTPDALRAIADELIAYAEHLDGREFLSRADMGRMLARVHPYIGCMPFEVPDGLTHEVEVAAGIDLPPEFDDRMEFDPDDDQEDAA